jgi:hypothetical protein
MVNHMMDNFNLIYIMEKDVSINLEGLCMMDIGNMEKNMVLEFLLIKINMFHQIIENLVKAGLDMKEIFIKITSKDKELCFGRQEKNL